MQLLISVAGPAEARAALHGGADVIDAKDPRRGALGPVSVQRLAAIRAAVAGARPLSAAVGDATSEQAVAGAVAAALSVGVAFVKLGLAGVTSEARAGRLAGAARRAVETAVVTRLVLVAYADWRSAASLPPARVVAVAADTGATGVLLDTATKRAPLFAVESRWGGRLGRGRARRGIVRRARRWPLRPGPRARALSRRRCRGRAGRGVRRGTDGPGFARSRGGPARPSRSGALSSSPDRAAGPPAARRRVGRDRPP